MCKLWLFRIILTAHYFPQLRYRQSKLCPGKCVCLFVFRATSRMGDETLLWIHRLLDLLHYTTMVRTLQLALYILYTNYLNPIILAFIHCVYAMVRQQLGNTDLTHSV